MMSGMAQPAKVLDFLDLFGTWDASLALVMAAALAVSSAGLCARQAPRAAVCSRRKANGRAAPTVDPPLVIGAVLFGVGWGLVGLCPGPALVNLATLSPQVIVFVRGDGLREWCCTINGARSVGRAAVTPTDRSIPAA